MIFYKENLVSSNTITTFYYWLYRVFLFGPNKVPSPPDKMLLDNFALQKLTYPIKTLSLSLSKQVLLSCLTKLLLELIGKFNSKSKPSLSCWFGSNPYKIQQGGPKCLQRRRCLVGHMTLFIKPVGWVWRLTCPEDLQHMTRGSDHLPELWQTVHIFQTPKIKNIKTCAHSQSGTIEKNFGH